MAELKIPVLNSLEEILQTSLDMEKSIRWKKYFKRGEARQENTLQHSYKASLLACIVLENEEEYCRNHGLPVTFDKGLVLESVILHDLGEIEEGDTVYIDKTADGDRKEQNYFLALITSLRFNIPFFLNFLKLCLHFT